MDLKERIEAFAELGNILRKSLSRDESRNTTKLDELIDSQYLKNGWFTPENVKLALIEISRELTTDNLNRWTDGYPDIKKKKTPYIVGIIMAGNIPLVGFHDFLCVLITGNFVLAKTSTRDSELIVYLGELLCSINPAFREMIKYAEGRLAGFDAVIATGSNNSSRYFEYYFSKYPSIIRKNRNSIAIIDGNESATELTDLGKDIFSYFGLGCRNVSKLYLPAGYELPGLINHWEGYSGIINHSKYANNYDFNKAVYYVNKEPFLDSGYLLLKEEIGISSPVAVLYYEYYKSKKSITAQTSLLKNNIQCIVSGSNTPFGKSQSPNLWDYADEIDTLEFLLKKKSSGIL